MRPARWLRNALIRPLKAPRSPPSGVRTFGGNYRSLSPIIDLLDQMERREGRHCGERSRDRALVLKVTDIIPDNSLSPTRSQEDGEGLPPPTLATPSTPLPQSLSPEVSPIMSYRGVFLSPCLPWGLHPACPPQSLPAMFYREVFPRGGAESHESTWRRASGGGHEVSRGRCGGSSGHVTSRLLAVLTRDLIRLARRIVICLLREPLGLAGNFIRFIHVGV